MRKEPPNGSVTLRPSCSAPALCWTLWSGHAMNESRSLHMEHTGVQTVSEQSLTWDIMDRFHTSGRSLELMTVKVLADRVCECWLGKHLWAARLYVWEGGPWPRPVLASISSPLATEGARDAISWALGCEAQVRHFSSLGSLP